MLSSFLRRDLAMRADLFVPDEKKFEEACANANRTAQAWLRVCDYLQYKPAPYSGFDLFNHMADVVTARGRVAAAEAFGFPGHNCIALSIPAIEPGI